MDLKRLKFAASYPDQGIRNLTHLFVDITSILLAHFENFPTLLNVLQVLSLYLNYSISNIFVQLYIEGRYLLYSFFRWGKIWLLPPSSF